MYPRYNMAYNPRNMYQRGRNDRLFGGGFLAPLVLGGIAGYAIGRPNYYQPYPYNYYYNNFYYSPYYW